MRQLTDNQLRLIAPSLSAAKRAELLPGLNAAFARCAINTKFQRAAYLANLLHESQQFTRLVENLNYSAERLLAVFHKYFTPLLAQIYAHHPEKIGSRVYANRMGNGDEASGEGYRYRGRGGIGRTGKKNYLRAQAALQLDVIAQPELLEQPQYAALSDALYWSDNRLNSLAGSLRGLHDANEQRTLTAICERINGGRNGLDERTRLYWRTLAVLEEQPSAQLAHATLQQGIAASPVIPTPETHTPADIAAEAAHPTAAVAAAEVALQEKATRLIDIAERVPTSAARTMAQSFRRRTIGRLVQSGIALWAALQAGNLIAWGGIIVVVLCVAGLIYANRHSLSRRYNLLLLKGRDLLRGAA